MKQKSKEISRKKYGEIKKQKRELEGEKTKRKKERNRKRGQREAILKEISNERLESTDSKICKLEK